MKVELIKYKNGGWTAASRYPFYVTTGETQEEAEERFLYGFSQTFIKNMVYFGPTTTFLDGTFSVRGDECIDGLINSPDCVVVYETELVKSNV